MAEPSAFIVILFAWFIVLPGTMALAQSQPCGNEAPEESAAWHNFMTAVSNNYGSQDHLPPAERLIVLGHALSRFERGAGGAADADCVRAALEMQAFDSLVAGDPADLNVYRAAAEQGQYDREVARLTGVRTSAPFTMNDIASRDPGYAAGASVGGRIGLSDGTGFRGADGEVSNLGDVEEPDGPNYRDLPNAAQGADYRSNTPRDNGQQNQAVSCGFGDDGLGGASCNCQYTENATAAEIAQAMRRACY